MSKISQDDPQITRIKRDLQKRELPVIVDLQTSVLYAEDAYEVFRYYVNRLAKVPLPKGDYQHDSHLLKMALGPKTVHETFYWLYMQEGLYYAVSVAYQKSKLYIGDCSSSPFVVMPYASRLDIYVKERRYFGEAIQLYGCFSLKDCVLTPELLVIKGNPVHNINVAPWNNAVDIQNPDKLQGYDLCGRKGCWKDHEYWRMYGITKKIWVGEKILKQYSADESPSYQDMIGCLQDALGKK